MQSRYTPELFAAVCDLVAEGKSLRSSCAAHGLTHTTFLDWCDREKALSDQYAQARTRGYELLADELVEISDESANDTYTDDDGNVKTNAEVVARSRLRVDTRKWMLSKMLPKVYGDKLTTEHTGPGGGPLQVQSIAIELVKPAADTTGSVSAPESGVLTVPDTTGSV